MRAKISLAATLLLAHPAVAGAQTSAERFQGQTLDYGMQTTSVFGVHQSDAPGRLDAAADVAVEFADRPIVARNVDTDETLDIVDKRLLVDLGVGVGLVRRLRLDVRTAITAYQSGDGLQSSTQPDEAGALNEFGFGDWRLGGQFTFTRREDLGVGIAARTTIWVPTGSDAGFVSDGVARVEPRLIADVALGDFVVVANAGYQVRGKRIAVGFRSDDVIRWGLATRWQWSDHGQIELASFGAHSPFPGRDPRDIDIDRPNSTAHPIELMAGASYDIGDVRVGIGVGRALTQAVGAPRLRVTTTIGYAPPGNAAAERADASSDDDDAIHRAGQRSTDCSGEPCLARDDDADRDGDGVSDRADVCPDDPGPVDRGGCPVADADGDGLDDFQDECPDLAEDPDQFQDDDGCPDPDNDGDGIADTEDRCPLGPETPNHFEDDDGCPDEAPELVKLQEDRIELLDRVHFDSNRATIKQRSFAMLEEVAALLAKRPDIERVSVEGHTDDVGRAASNLALSAKRARAVVEFLVSRGVATERLVARGFGESHPLVPNDDDASRAQNRRVEFIIVNRKRSE